MKLFLYVQRNVYLKQNDYDLCVLQVIYARPEVGIYTSVASDYNLCVLQVIYAQPEVGIYTSVASDYNLCITGDLCPAGGGNLLFSGQWL